MRSDFVVKAPPSAKLIGGFTTAQPFLLLTPLTSPSPTPIVNPAAQPTFVGVPGTGRFEQRKIGVRASGLINIGGDVTVTFNFYGNAGAIDPVAANNTLLASGAASLAAASGLVYPWWLDLDVIFDSISGKTGGKQSAQVGNTPVAAAAMSNQLTGLNGQNESVFNIGVFVGLSAANANTYILLQDFGIEG